MGRRHVRHILSALLAALLVAGAACKDAPPPAPTAAPAAVPAPAEPPALELGPSDPAFGVTDLVFCRAVELRRCVNEGWRFPPGTRRVWAFLTLRSISAARGVTVRWLHGDPAGGAEERQAVRLHVGQNPRWRTWAFLDLERTVPASDASVGWWTVEVVHPDGRTVMARRRFFVER